MGKRSAGCKFPVARIKKIIQADEEVGKVAASTPVAVCKALEMFIDHILGASAQQATAAGSRKISPYHFKRTVNEDDTFDFLREIVAKIPDPVAPSDDKPKRRRNTAASDDGADAREAPAAGTAAAAAAAEGPGPEAGSASASASGKAVPARRPRRAATKPAPVETNEDAEEGDETPPPPRKRGRQQRSGSDAEPKDVTPPAPLAPAEQPPAPPALDDDEDYDADE